MIQLSVGAGLDNLQAVGAGLDTAANKHDLPILEKLKNLQQKNV